MDKTWDVVIIGGGVIGCAVARELSRYHLSVCLLEKAEDVCSGTSKANSAIVHAGFDAKPGTLKAKMNVLGSRMMQDLSRELDFPYSQNGALVLCLEKESLPNLQELYRRGLENGVEGLCLLSGDEARAMEGRLSDSVVGALYAKTSAIICPFELTVALAENASENGVSFFMQQCVQRIRKNYGIYEVETQNGRFSGRCIVNAAGVYADEINNMVSARKLKITPRKGDYCLLDREAGSHVSATVFQLPGKLGKGVLVTPTVHGNLLLGPSATNIEDKNATETTAQDLKHVLEKSALGVRDIPFNQIITSFTGLRASEAGGDFILGEAPDAPGFFNAAGIESPGLSAAPAIGAHLSGLVAGKLNAEPKAQFNPRRKGIVHPAKLAPAARAELIRENPLYGKIVCRCEQISEGEMVEAIRRPVGAKSMDGVKRRVRAGMGRCQGGFCTPRIMEILARELDIPLNRVCKNMPGSELVAAMMEEDRHDCI